MNDSILPRAGTMTELHGPDLTLTCWQPGNRVLTNGFRGW